MKEVVEKEIIKWMDVGIIYSIVKSNLVCLVSCMLKRVVLLWFLMRETGLSECAQCLDRDFAWTIGR